MSITITTKSNGSKSKATTESDSEEDSSSGTDLGSLLNRLLRENLCQSRHQTHGMQYDLINQCCQQVFVDKTTDVKVAIPELFDDIIVYTADDLETARKAIKLFEPFVLGESPVQASTQSNTSLGTLSNEITYKRLLDMNTPMTILECAKAGIQWNLWYIDQLKDMLAKNQPQTDVSACSFRELKTELEAFSSWMKVVMKLTVPNNTRLTNFTDRLMRMIAFCFVHRCQYLDPFCIFPQALDLAVDVCKVPSAVFETENRRDTGVFDQMTSAMETTWNSQLVMSIGIEMKRKAVDPHRFIAPTLRRMMYKVSILNMTDLVQGFDQWQKKQTRGHPREQLVDQLQELLSNLRS